MKKHISLVMLGFSHTLGWHMSTETDPTSSQMTRRRQRSKHSSLSGYQSTEHQLSIRCHHETIPLPCSLGLVSTPLVCTDMYKSVLAHNYLQVRAATEDAARLIMGQLSASGGGGRGAVYVQHAVCFDFSVILGASESTWPLVLCPVAR